MSTTEYFPARSDGVDMMLVARVIWVRRRLVALVTCLFGLAAALIAIYSVPIYRAEVVLTDAREGSLSRGASLANQLGGLGALAGVNLSAGSSSSREAQAVLHSRYLVEEFIKRNGLLDVLLPPSGKPRPMWAAVLKFQQSVLKISDDVRRGTTTVAIEWSDPVLTARWANGFVALANEIVRTRAMEDSKRNIAFLKEQIAQSSVAEIRNILFELVETETKTLMLANGRLEYAFTVVDPAVPSELRIRPKRSVITLIGVFVGFCLAVGIVLILNRVQRGRPLSHTSNPRPGSGSGADE